MSRKLYHILLYTLIYSIISASCWNWSKEEPQVCPKPELIFPGAKDLAIKSSKETVAIISEFSSKLSNVAPFIMPSATIVHKILKGVTTMTNLLSRAKSEVGKLIERNLAIAAVSDIEAKLATVRNRLDEVNRYNEHGESFDVPIRLAAQQCEEIRLKFSNKDNFLFKNESILYSSPSLMAFVGIYAGVAGFKFEMSKLDRNHVVMEMKALKSCVEDYREAAVAKRMSFVKIKADPAQVLYDILEENYRVVTGSWNYMRTAREDLYDGIHGILSNFQTSKLLDSEHAVTEMTSLQSCVGDYWSAAREGWSIYQKKIYLGPKPSMNYFSFCMDNLSEITSCESCPQIKCDEQEFLDQFEDYKTSLEQIYRSYWDGPLEDLGKLIETFEQNISN